MSEKRTLYLAAAIFCLMLSSTLTTFSAAYQPPIYNKNDLPVLLPRTSPLNITIVYIGFEPECINTTYSTWILARWKPQEVLIPQNDWGVNFSFSYTYVFTNQTFRNNFETYLASIRQTVFLANPYYGGAPRSNDFYEANKVEEYLYPKLSSINALPSNGYTAIITNLTSGWVYGEIQPHYYNITYSDLDSWAVLSRQWMLGWGGHHRFWFLDVSAGTWPNPANPSYSGFGFNPIWNLLNSYPEIGNFRSNKGINFLTEYTSDFISGMISDLFTPDFIYPPRISDNYEIIIYAFDNCTGYLNATKPLIDTGKILTAFRKLVPYATWTVTVRYVHFNATVDPEPYESLKAVIRSAEFASTSSVDLVPVWKYFEANMGAYVTPITGRVTIPVFVFQLKSNWYFSYEGKGIVKPRPWDPPTVDAGGQLWGISLYSMVLIGHDVSDAQSGFGFTETIIHETGHQMGLMHPHQYDWLQDFSATAMSYYTYEYVFSQFDNDTISRGHADYYIIKAQSMMNNATELQRWKQLNSTLVRWFTQGYGNLTNAFAQYDRMNYTGARIYAKQALNLFTQFVAGASQQPPFDDEPPVFSNLQLSNSTPSATDQVHVNVTVQDLVSGVKNVTLSYKIGGGSWQTLTMTKIIGDIYTATIPQALAGSTVYFYVRSYDNNQNSGSTTIQFYIVQSPALPDDVPPVFTNLQFTPTTPSQTDQVQVTITVQDLGSGVKNATLHYRVGTSGVWQSIAMTNSTANVFTATIPQASAGSTMYFYIIAYDTKGNPASTTIQFYAVQAPPVESPINITTAGYIVIGLLVGLAIGLMVKRRPIVR
jgi:hypothetical protein